MLASTVWYLGGLLAGAGVLALIRPMRRLGLGTRRRAAAVAFGGLLLAALTLTGVRDRRVEAPQTLLDAWMPVYQFHEVHAMAVSAPASRVYAAIFEVTADDVRFFRTLVWIRRFGRSGPESILDPSTGGRLIETAERTTFRRLAEAPGRELVLATLVAAPASAAGRTWTPEAFARLDEPGFAKAAMNFVVDPVGLSASVVRTETRVLATDPATRRAFTVYWRTIHPGSALIRRGWLDAIRRRAEGR